MFLVIRRVADVCNYLGWHLVRDDLGQCNATILKVM